MADAEENRAEQADEIEALESMYPDDFELIHGADGPAGDGVKPTFKISLLPTEPADEEVNHVGCVLEVECPPTYPSDTEPVLRIHPLKKLTEAQVKKLRGIAEEAAQENVGAPAVFMVIEAIREWLMENNEDPGDGSAFSEMMRRQRDSQRAQAEAEAAEAAAEQEARGDMTEEEIAAAKRKAEGTPCTDETFHAWNNAFMAEIEAKNAQEGRVGLQSQKAGGESDPEAYMTGREWFEQKILQGNAMGSTLEGMGDEPSDDDGEDDASSQQAAEGGSNAEKPAAVDVNAAIFLNAPADDLDLDDFSDED
eukprot:INCI19879.1.p1 GENE.INCI19879.1~~INCI19879.1.p1  ORF type:complete len:309 (-),score=94.53 INCI19879.1:61-987(-)